MNNIIFLNACLEISNELASFGFKAIQKGQILKKVSDDKDLFYQIYFQSSSLNSKSNIIITPHISIYSKTLKKWFLEKFKIDNNGLIFTAQLGHITSRKQWKNSNLAGFSYKTSVTEILEDIKNVALPIFDIFKTKESAINFLKCNGTKFNAYSEKTLFPLDFMLCFAKKEETQMFFSDFVKDCSYRGKIIKLYKDLKMTEKIDLNYSEFWFANKVKLAFASGLELKMDQNMNDGGKNE